MGKRRRESPHRFRAKIFGPSSSPYALMESPEYRGKLIEVLRQNPDDRIQSLCDQAEDKTLKTPKSIASIARSLGLHSKEIAKAFMDGKIDEGIVRMAEHIPDVMEDVAVDAKSRDVACNKCDGVGIVHRADGVDEHGEKQYKQVQCPFCEGKGTVRQIGDTDARKLIFEAAKLTGVRGPLIAQQINEFSGDRGIEDLLQSARQLAAPKTTITIESKGEENATTSDKL